MSRYPSDNGSSYNNHSAYNNGSSYDEYYNEGRDSDEDQAEQDRRAHLRLPPLLRPSSSTDPWTGSSTRARWVSTKYAQVARER